MIKKYTLEERIADMTTQVLKNNPLLENIKHHDDMIKYHEKCKNSLYTHISKSPELGELHFLKAVRDGKIIPIYADTCERVNIRWI